MLLGWFGGAKASSKGSDEEVASLSCLPVGGCYQHNILASAELPHCAGHAFAREGSSTGLFRYVPCCSYDAVFCLRPLSTCIQKAICRPR